MLYKVLFTPVDAVTVSHLPRLLSLKCLLLRYISINIVYIIILTATKTYLHYYCISVLLICLLIILYVNIFLRVGTLPLI
jgi:hypothetical protein